MSGDFKVCRHRLHVNNDKPTLHFREPAIELAKAREHVLFWLGNETPRMCKPMDRYFTPAHLRNIVRCLDEMKSSPPTDEWQLTTRLTEEKVYLVHSSFVQEENGLHLHSFSASLNGGGIPSPLARVLMSWMGYVLNVPLHDPGLQLMHSDGGRFYIRFLVNDEEHARVMAYRLPEEALSDEAIERTMLDIFKEARTLEMDYAHVQEEADALIAGDPTVLAKHSDLPDHIMSRIKRGR